jgi:hypothetical protein
VPRCGASLLGGEYRSAHPSATRVQTVLLEGKQLGVVSFPGIGELTWPQMVALVDVVIGMVWTDPTREEQLQVFRLYTSDPCQHVQACDAAYDCRHASLQILGHAGLTGVTHLRATPACAPRRQGGGRERRAVEHSQANAARLAARICSAFAGVGCGRQGDPADNAPHESRRRAQGDIGRLEARFRSRAGGEAYSSAVLSHTARTLRQRDCLAMVATHAARDRNGRSPRHA